MGHLKVVAEPLVHQELGALKGHRGDSLGQSVKVLDSAGVKRRDGGLRLRWGRRPSIRRRRWLGTWKKATLRHRNQAFLIAIFCTIWVCQVLRNYQSTCGIHGGCQGTSTRSVPLKRREARIWLSVVGSSDVITVAEALNAGPLRFSQEIDERDDVKNKREKHNNREDGISAINSRYQNENSITCPRHMVQEIFHFK